MHIVCAICIALLKYEYKSQAFQADNCRTKGVIP